MDVSSVTQKVLDATNWRDLNETWAKLLSGLCLDDAGPEQSVLNDHLVRLSIQHVCKMRCNSDPDFWTHIDCWHDAGSVSTPNLAF